MGFAVAYFTAANVTKLPVSLPFSLKKNLYQLSHHNPEKNCLSNDSLFESFSGIC
jgi:hypothetical protein